MFTENLFFIWFWCVFFFIMNSFGKFFLENCIILLCYCCCSWHKKKLQNGIFFFLPFLFFIKNNHLYGLLMAHKQIAILFKKIKKGLIEAQIPNFCIFGVLYIFFFVHFWCSFYLSKTTEEHNNGLCPPICLWHFVNTIPLKLYDRNCSSFGRIVSHDM